MTNILGDVYGNYPNIVYVCGHHTTYHKYRDAGFMMQLYLQNPTKF